MQIVIPESFKFHPCPKCFYNSLESEFIENGERAYACKYGHTYTHAYLIGMLKEGRISSNMKVKQSVSIDDGTYPAVITDVLERTDPYEYTDFVIDVDVESDKPVELKYGCPSALSLDKDGKPTTKLAQLLSDLGLKFEIDQEITIESIKKAMIGKKVTIMTSNKTTDKGTFAQIVSFKPA